MSDPLLRALDHYVVLEPPAAERILTAAETLGWLSEALAALEARGSLPADLLALSGNEARAQRLLETACELELAPGCSVSWYAVRLEPPGGDPG